MQSLRFLHTDEKLNHRIEAPEKLFARNDKCMKTDEKGDNSLLDYDHSASPGYPRSADKHSAGLPVIKVLL